MEIFRTEFSYLEVHLNVYVRTHLHSYLPRYCWLSDSLSLGRTTHLVSAHRGWGTWSRRHQKKRLHETNSTSKNSPKSIDSPLLEYRLNRLSTFRDRSDSRPGRYLKASINSDLFRDPLWSLSILPMSGWGKVAMRGKSGLSKQSPIHDEIENIQAGTHWTATNEWAEDEQIGKEGKEGEQNEDIPLNLQSHGVDKVARFLHFLIFSFGTPLQFFRHDIGNTRDNIGSSIRINECETKASSEDIVNGGGILISNDISNLK